MIHAINIASPKIHYCREIPILNAIDDLINPYKGLRLAMSFTAFAA